jgi:RNA-directed DNA polymerase
MVYKDLWKEFCSYENFELSFRKARKNKTLKTYVIEFEKNLKNNILELIAEMVFHSYRPKPLETFIIRDPKTRKISKSDFRDRIVHHALCNIIEPIFEKSFIYDSYANRINKGTLKAIKRFDYFKRKVSRNNRRNFFILKADIKQYFENVDQLILVSIIKTRVRDKRILWLIRMILSNYKTNECGKGMPLGNLTSQFFANVYLNMLDQYIKEKLKIKYYIRYVDDFVIFDADEKKLEFYKEKIDVFLKSRLSIQLHKDKSKILKFGRSIKFLGFRVFPYYKLLKKSNLRKMRNKFYFLKEKYKNSEISYDIIYDFLEGWIAYAKNADTFNLRKKILEDFDAEFPNKLSAKEINKYLKIKKEKIKLLSSSNYSVFLFFSKVF